MNIMQKNAPDRQRDGRAGRQRDAAPLLCSAITKLPISETLRRQRDADFGRREVALF